MKKYFVMAIMAIVSVSLLSCGDDDEIAPVINQEDTASAKVLAKLSNNQMTIGTTKEVTIKPFVSVRTAKNDDPGAHYVSIQCTDDNDEVHSIRFDLGTPLVKRNAVVDLSNPIAGVAGDQFSFGYSRSPKLDVNNEVEAFGMDVSGDSFYSYYKNNITGDDLQYSTPDVTHTCFTEGRFTASHTSEGFTICLNAMLENGLIIAFKGFVPESEVDYWK